MTNKPHIEVILPIFNEAENLPLLIKQMDEVALRLSNEATLSYLFVNDGSSDGSRDLLLAMVRERTDVRLVDLIHNFGHGAALAAGIDHFQGDVAVLMDADLQDNPMALIALFEAWKRGSSTVVAERGKRQEKNRLLFKVFYRLLHKTSKQIPPVAFGTHCLLDRNVVDRIRQLKERNRYFPGLVSFSSNSVTPVVIDRQARRYGESRVGMVGLLNLAVTALLSFSSTPVKLVSILGLCCAAASIFMGLAIVGIKIFTPLAIPGWASMMTAMAFGSGIQLLCLGIIGEYIARIYDEVKQRPLYLVDKVYNVREDVLGITPPRFTSPWTRAASADV